ncbi:S1 RNA-binding domain-containing protein [Enterocloster citroniae]|uniref:S1 RNA-binding domain-containing protein n=1 Tax=Enterocloster citroniae TaxID=358743 RepID=UPI00349E5D8F
MSEEMNKELEGQVTAQEVAPEEAAAEKVTAEEPVETMEDFAAELEASYQTLNKRKIELAEEESGAGAKWAQFQQMMDDRTVVKVKISEAVKGGVVTTLEEVRAFIPASQLSTEYVEKLEDWQGKYVECIIITVDPEKKRLVLSGREVEREKKEAEKKARMEQFKAGDVVEGTVDSIKPYGAFVKLADGVDGLLHISQISTQRIKHPGVVLTEGQTVKVKILSMENGKLSLSMRVLSEQTAEREEHETFDYKETGSVSTGLGDLLKGLKL